MTDYDRCYGREQQLNYLVKRNFQCVMY